MWMWKDQFSFIILKYSLCSIKQTFRNTHDRLILVAKILPKPPQNRLCQKVYFLKGHRRGRCFGHMFLQEKRGFYILT